MGLYTFLYGNPLYRLYIIHIQPPRIVPARLSRYTAHTAYTAIQVTAIHAIHHTALYSLPQVCEGEGTPIMTPICHVLLCSVSRGRLLTC